MVNVLSKQFRGYIVVSTKSNDVERYFNLCRARKISIWNIRQYNLDNEKYVQFCISIKDYKKSKDIIKKTKVKLCIKRKIGLPFLTFRYRKHYSFVIGILVSMITIYTLSLFIWDISFDGNFTYTDDVLMSFLNECNITPGILVENLNCSSIEKEIRRKYNDISWVSAELKGTRLIVHIKENDLSIGVSTNEDENKEDLIAKSDGIIVSMITRNGTPMFKVGDEVKKGDILVSKEVVVYDDAKEPVNTNVVRADADVVIKTNYEYRDELPKLHEYKVYTGKSKGLDYFYIFNNYIDVGIIFKQFENFDAVTSEETFRLTDNFYLPIKKGKKTFYEYNIEQGEYTIDDANAILYDNYSIYLEKLQKKAIQIIDSSVKIDVLDDGYVCSGIVYVNEKQ